MIISTLRMFHNWNFPFENLDSTALYLRKDAKHQFLNISRLLDLGAKDGAL